MLNLEIKSSTSAKQTKTTQVRHNARLALLIERAALALGIDKSAFLRIAIEREALRVIEVQSNHVLTREDAEQFTAALDAPPAPTPRALEAARNYRARVLHAD